MKERKPRLYVIAGCNGSGKTTFATTYLPRYAGCVEFVNADLIAAGISPFAPERAAFRAGRLVLRTIRQLGKSRHDFAFETTLSGQTYEGILSNMRKEGYRIHLFYLWIPSPELGIRRIAERVADGGHPVPETDVRRRFGKSLRNLFRFYSPIAETTMLFDNSARKPRPIAERISDGSWKIYDRPLFERLQEEANR